ncbi:hypothetical protein AVEN_73526-1 [Araneus ventricosus]|uniref:Uncharacterized protein n=1 Tax=Araneus ventricosus TaxID=182803 RepID=A0A4Y2M0E7_ARAVE|nr:hypothetical protein AVEN_125139-1 [Araneus ventricosus]GBN19890.1 hypothetical protein AVEN_73526-1 [Araneus ventricosus]
MSDIFVSHEPSGLGDLSENYVLAAVNVFKIAFTSVGPSWTCQPPCHSSRDGVTEKGGLDMHANTDNNTAGDDAHGFTRAGI